MTARLFTLGVLAAACLAAQGAAAQPADALSGVVRVWGHGSVRDDYVGPLLAALEQGFRARHPGVSFANTLRGDDTAIGGLYTGQADIALMERVPIAIELDAYQPIFKADPFGVSIATGSVAAPHHANPLAILVHPDNPLRELTLAQVDAVFGADRRRGAPAAAHLWGELGLTGAWAAQPIHVYIPPITHDDAQFFESAVMKGSQKWTGALREVGDRKASAATEAAAGTAAAVARDRYGIALSSTRYADQGGRALALADGGEFIPPTPASVASRGYPLARKVSMFAVRAPDRPLAPAVKAFLQYVLGDEGQAAIARDGGYYPLAPETAQREKEKLQ